MYHLGTDTFGTSEVLKCTFELLLHRLVLLLSKYNKCVWIGLPSRVNTRPDLRCLLHIIFTSCPHVKYWEHAFVFLPDRHMSHFFFLHHSSFNY